MSQRENKDGNDAKPPKHTSLYSLISKIVAQDHAKQIALAKQEKEKNGK